MKRIQAARGRADIHRAWTRAQIEAAVERILEDWAHKLPADTDARVVVKPNLNNDLLALTGNSVDLRVLGALLRGLQRRGYHRLTVADGSNVGIARRGIDSFERLRVAALCRALGVRWQDLNRDQGTRMSLHAGARPRIANTVLEQDLLISIPKIKTHAEMQFSCALKNWVGLAIGQDKRHLHYDLARNICAINEVLRPDLILTDGLIGMEGNGPGDGDPFRLGLLMASDDAFLNDMVACRLADMPWREVPYLAEAGRRGLVGSQLEEELAQQLEPWHRIKRSPPRSLQARLSERRSLVWLKLAVRPLVNRPRFARLAYRLNIIQDVYQADDDSLRLAGRDPERCRSCGRCADFCPLGLEPGAFGAQAVPDTCLHCLYCWFVCPHQALGLEGDAGHLARQIERYRHAIEEL